MTMVVFAMYKYKFVDFYKNTDNIDLKSMKILLIIHYI